MGWHLIRVDPDVCCLVSSHKSQFCTHLQVIWLNLYSTVSSRDIGTMYAARNVTNSKNVTADPSGNYYASSLMADKFTDAYLVAGALEHFDMEMNSEPKQNVYSGEIGNASDMKNYILQQARSFVECMVEIGVRPLPDYGLQSNTKKCRYCDKLYKGRLPLRRHEYSVHGHRDPKYSNDWVADEEPSETENDMVINYTKLTLALGLLRLNHNDAIAMGDGDRIMLVNQYLFFLYKHKKNNCPKYAFGMLETICQSKILLTPRLAHRLKWNRTVNHRGKKDTNHPNDLDIEHCNKIFKDEAHSYRGIFTEKTISRVSRSALSTYQIVKNYDKQTDVHEASGVHTNADLSADIELIVNQLVQSNVFKRIPGRRHEAFPSVSPNPLIMDMEGIRDWISASLEKFSAKHFYPKQQ